MYNYKSAVHVAALYGPAGLYSMMGKAQTIMAEPLWPSRIHNGLVHPIMAWLNPVVKFKPRSQIINKLTVVCSGMA